MRPAELRIADNQSCSQSCDRPLRSAEVVHLRSLDNTALLLGAEVASRTLGGLHVVQHPVKGCLWSTSQMSHLLYLGVQLVVLRAVKRKVVHPPHARWIVSVVEGWYSSFTLGNTPKQGIQSTSWERRDREREEAFFSEPELDGSLVSTVHGCVVLKRASNTFQHALDVELLFVSLRAALCPSVLIGTKLF